jgi:hypothetical protein
MAVKPVIELRFCGGVNNNSIGIDVFFAKKGETQSCINADLSFVGQIRPLKPLLKVNDTAATNIHSLFVINGNIFCVDDTMLKHSSLLSTLLAGLASTHMSWANVGQWIFYCNGTNKGAIYIPTPAVIDWGASIPAAAPTVAVGAGTLTGDYYCYYRHKITLADGTIIRTALSPVANISPAAQSIEWSGIVHSTFSGATTIEVELFRGSVTATSLYLVTTLAAGTTTFSDDVSDVDLVLGTVYAETEYSPPPAGLQIVKYSPSADRVFASKDGDVYWSEAAKYHTFLYNATTGEYRNVNSVFLGDDKITSIQVIDENTYFGSIKTWRRLRGTNPSSWQFEDTNAICGPMNDESVADLPWGKLYPGKDGYMWMFNGFDSRKLFEDFVFAVNPTNTAHAVYDGRFYYLYYDDPTNPELIIDFYKYPAKPARIVQSTRTAVASCYDGLTKQTYISDGGYIRSGANIEGSVITSFRTAEVNVEDLIQLGDMASIIFRTNTQGDSLIITPYFDGVAQPSLNAIITSALQYINAPLPIGDSRMMFFDFLISSDKAFVIEEPMLIRKGDD